MTFCPQPQDHLSIIDREALLSYLSTLFPTPAPVAAPEAGELVARQNQDITTILTSLNNDLKVPLDQLSSMTASTATSDNVNTVVQQIVPMIQSATTALNSASGTGSGDPLSLVGNTISSVMSAANSANSVTTDGGVLVVLQLLDPVLAALVALVLQLVAGVLTVVIGLLVGLLGGIIGLILGLDFASLAGVLGL